MKMLLAWLMLLAAGWLFAEDPGIAEFDYPDVKIIAIQDKEASFPASLFSPAYPTSFKQEAKEYPASVNVFLLLDKKTGSATLVDTGYGELRGGNLLQKLNALQIPPEKVEAVCISHIHPDHVGGLMRPKSLASNAKTLFSHAEEPAFPNAAVYIARTEYDRWQEDPKREDLRQYLKPYLRKLCLFDYDYELKGPFGVLIPRFAGGHTPGHTVFERKTASGEKIFFVGDLLHAADLQITHFEFCAAYDGRPNQAAAVRHEALLIYNGHWFGAHFPFPGRIFVVKEIHADGEDVFRYSK